MTNRLLDLYMDIYDLFREEMDIFYKAHTDNDLFYYVNYKSYLEDNDELVSIVKENFEVELEDCSEEDILYYVLKERLGLENELQLKDLSKGFIVFYTLERDYILLNETDLNRVLNEVISELS